ncbi:myosin, light chain 1 [Branchiostoma belcheri]|nr:myosin, light chain 1 [Branchiostoma belcheri]
MAEIEQSMIDEMKDGFPLFDNKGDGKIDGAQLGDVLRSFGLNPSNAEVEKIAKANEGKRLSFDDYLAIHKQVLAQGEVGSYEDFFEGLKLFDKEGTGLISGAELRHVLATLGEKLTEAQVDELMAGGGGQEDAEGNVNYDMFSKYALEG